jgi:hypothetical protein
LKSAVKSLTKKTSDDSFAEMLAKLTVERDSLKKETDDMKAFLSDYGLTWLGTEGLDEGDDPKSYYKANLPNEIDTEILSRRIEELNFIAEKNKIVNMNGMHKYVVGV